MADTNDRIDDDKIDSVELAEERKMTREEAEEYAKRQQYGQSGGIIGATMGNMGGAGASASGPDIAKQSEGVAWNSSDLPKR